MVTVGLLLRFEVKPGFEADVERTLKTSALAIESDEPGTIAWFGVRLGASTFAVFDVFPDDESRQIHIAAGLERMKAIKPAIVEGSLVVERHDVVAAKLPK